MKKLQILELFSLVIFWSYFIFGGLPLAAQNNPFDPETEVVNTTPAGSTRAAADLVSINCARVNIRSGPGTNYKVLNTFSQGTTGKKIEEKNGWFLIEFENGSKGWVRGDLVSSKTSLPPVASPADKKSLEKSFARWDKHLGNSALDYSRLPSYWGLGKAYQAFLDGDLTKAYDLAQDNVSNPLQAKYLTAKILYRMGKYAEAKSLIKTIEKTLEDTAFSEMVFNFSKPYIDEPIVFKFGGFDSLAEFQKKVSGGARVGLNSSEYYEKFVDINTWKWRSKEAYKEFQSIAGIDCSGFVQRVQKEMFAKAKVSYPISGRTSTSGLWSQKFTKSINPGFKPPPPPDIRPGDMILLDYGHNRYGHSMIYRGVDAAGNIRVVMMGDTAQEAILSPEKYQYYKGAYRMNGMDKVRTALTS